MTPTLPERLIGPTGLSLIVEVPLLQVCVPKLALLLIVLLDVCIAAIQCCCALGKIRECVMDHVSCVAARPERLVHTL